MARLFVAVSVPESVAGPIEALPRPTRPDVRWTTRDQWHVTLRFLGRAEPDEVAGALAGFAAPAVDAVVSAVPELLGGHVLVLPVDGLDELAGRVASVTEGIGDVPARSDFRGHLTLARSRSGAFPEVAPLPGPIGFRVVEIALASSDTRPDGARHRPVARFPLIGD